MMLQKKKSGFILLEAVLAILLMSMASYGLAMTSALQFNQLEAKQVANEAEQYAMNEVEYLRRVGFDDLDEALHDRKSNLEFSGVDGWESVTSFVTEKAIDDDRSIKIAKVEVYKEGENIPRYSMEVPLSSQSSSLSVPVGTIWPYTGDLNEIPDDWHLCDGTNGTPDLRNRFLEGTTTKANMFVEAGLPNITGKHYTDNTSAEYYYSPSGVYTYIHGKNLTLEGSTSYTSGWLLFDASRCSSIYGNSNTVQPASYTVYYIMKIK